MTKHIHYILALAALGSVACGDDSTDEHDLDSGALAPDDAGGSSTPSATTAAPSVSSTAPGTTGATSSAPQDAGFTAPDAGVDASSAGGASNSGDAGTDASVAIDAGRDLDASTGSELDASSGSDAAAARDAAADAASDAGDEPMFPGSAVIANAQLPPEFVAWRWAEAIPDPRGITVDQAGRVLLISRENESVMALIDENGDGVIGGVERVEIASAPGLAHGIALTGGYLYASNDTTVYRFEYEAERVDLGEPEVVVDGIPGGGRHTSRTLAFDDVYLYVSVGSGDNVDADSSRAQIRRFPIVAFDEGALDYAEGELFADGLRNEVGVAVDALGRVWGVENGRDELSRPELGDDIYIENPGEELNLFAEPGRFYGYPYCWSEGILEADAGLGAGTQWADPDNTAQTDEWCRDPENVVPPVMVMTAHTAPLDLLFYQGTGFPSEYVGDAIVTLHGSWNRPLDDARGFKVVRLPFGDDGMPTGEVVGLLEFAGPGDRPVEESEIDSQWPIRPVGLAVLPDGTLLVTSDASNEVIAIGYTGAR